MAKEETPVAFCDASAAPPESGQAAGSRTEAARPTLLRRMFQCAVKILIGVLACCIIRSAAPEVTHARKGVLPGSLVVWAVVPLGIYACFIWNIFRVSKIKEKD